MMTLGLMEQGDGNFGEARRWYDRAYHLGDAELQAFVDARKSEMPAG